MTDPHHLEQPILAALDLGSNSFHMVIARINQGSLQILARHKERVRLASGLDEDGWLEQQAFDRGIESLRHFAERLDGFARRQVRVVATHTLRNAHNRNAFIEAARDVLAHPIELISGHEEARLIYQAIAYSEALIGKTLVIDIGGGSTELALGEGYALHRVTSRRMGCVSYSQHYFADGNSADAFSKARIAAHQSLENIVMVFRSIGWEQIFVTSGTAEALMQGVQALGHSDGVLTLKRLQELEQAFCAGGQSRARITEAVSEHRIPVLPGGLAIMQAIFEALDLTEAHFSNAALREGVLYEMDDSIGHEDVRLRTRDSLLARYHVDQGHAGEVVTTARRLWEQTATAWKLPPETQALLEHAAWLHEVGIDINSSAMHKHGAYVLANCDLPGFNKDEQALLSVMVRFQRKRIKPSRFADLIHYSNKLQLRLITLLRLAVALNLGRQPNFVPAFTATASGKQLTLAFADDWLSSQVLVQADLQHEAEWLAPHKIYLTYH